MMRAVLSAPDAYIEWVNAHLGFNPRSQANSNALSDFVVADLRQHCPRLLAHLDTNAIVPATNAVVRTRFVPRNVDLVIKEPKPPNMVRLSIEHKTIMTAHGKARWNRYGDIIAYTNHMHNHRRECIAAAVVIINCSAAYQNPDAFAQRLVRPRFDMRKVVKDTVKIFAEIPLRNTSDEPNDQPEAIAVILIDYDGRKPAKLVASAEHSAPQPSSPIHYESFVRRLCELYTKRFGRG